MSSNLPDIAPIFLRCRKGPTNTYVYHDYPSTLVQSIYCTFVRASSGGNAHKPTTRDPEPSPSLMQAYKPEFVLASTNSLMDANRVQQKPPTFFRTFIRDMLTMGMLVTTVRTNPPTYHHSFWIGFPCRRSTASTIAMK